VGVPAFITRNTKDIRRPEIHAVAKALRDKYKGLGAVGYCFGGWAVFSLASTTDLVDCIATAHPTWLTKEEIDAVSVPVQILAPEVDLSFHQELKDHCHKVIPTRDVAYDYQFFPGVEHAFATRGNLKDVTELRAMTRAKNAVVGWMRLWLHDYDVGLPKH
jgi:dienelactone hydrolase